MFSVQKLRAVEWKTGSETRLASFFARGEI